MDSFYISKPEQLIEDEEFVGGWHLLSVLSQSKTDITYRAMGFPGGLEGYLKISRHQTYDPKLRRKKMVWLGQKLWSGLVHGVLGTLGKKILTGTSLRVNDEIEREQEMYFILTEYGARFIPLVLDFGYFKGRSYIVLQQHGASVAAKLDKRWSISRMEACAIGLDAVGALHQLHRLGFLHRNLSDEALVYDRSDQGGRVGKVHLTNYGQAKKAKRSVRSVFKRGTREFVGSRLFAPVAAHQKARQSTRDDLESFAYLLVYLFLGWLPWSKEVETSNSVYDHDETEMLKIEFKSNIKSHACAEELPAPILHAVDYIFRLAVKERPNYEFISDCLKKALLTVDEDTASDGVISQKSSFNKLLNR